MKLFQCTILASQLESAISLPGWSHAQRGERKRAVSYYPFEAPEKVVFFHAKHRTEAARHLQRHANSARDLVEYQPETPERITARKRELARRLCMEETQRGDFSRVALYRSIWFLNAQEAKRD
jgi:hypothetical protein